MGVERFSLGRTWDWSFWGLFGPDFRIELVAGIRMFGRNPEPSTQEKKKTEKPKHAVTRENLGDYELRTSGNNFVIRAYRGLRVEVDPHLQVVQVDGSTVWVETNYEDKRFGFAPDNTPYLRSDDSLANEVEWTTEYQKDRDGNLIVDFDFKGKRFRVAVNVRRKYVVVWDAAIKALYKTRYIMAGPNLPLSPPFSEMKTERPSSVVSIADHLRSA